RARQARIAQVAPTETRVADATVPPAPDPLQNLQSLTPPPAQVAGVDAPREPRSTIQPDAAGGSSAQTTLAKAPTPPMADSLGEAIRPQPQPVIRAADATGHEAIIREIQSSGGSIGQDSNGAMVFSLPSAAGTTMASAKGSV